METLAVHGGTPVREKKIYYGRQWITQEDADAVAEVLLGDYITTGPKVDELEKKLCAYTGAGYATAVSNGTAALHLAVLAAGIGPGDEVITTGLTFMASANCALYCGATPVFADIDPQTYNIDPEQIERCITPRTKAVVAVDFAGCAIDHLAIRDICDRHHLVFIEDAAHAIGTSNNGKMVGSIADMTCFSFHPVKTVTSGEGGAILTDSPEYHHRLQLLRSHGIEHEESCMVEAPHEGIWYYEQQMLGYNYRMTDFQAALLISQLGRIDQFISRRKEITARYNEVFSDMEAIGLQQELSTADNVHHLYILRLVPEKLSCTRRMFFDAMSAENVQCQVHYVPVYWSPYYKSLGYKEGLCPSCEEVYKNIMSIPLYPKMTDQDVNDVIHAVKKITAFYSV